jgi:hypothetical protein
MWYHDGSSGQDKNDNRNPKAYVTMENKNFEHFNNKHIFGIVTFCVNPINWIKKIKNFRIE